MCVWWGSYGDSGGQGGGRMLFLSSLIPCTDLAPSMNLLIGSEVAFFSSNHSFLKLDGST